MIYLDNAATTRIDDVVLAEMLPYLKENYANASSLHSLGRKSRQAVEHAREQVAKSINADPNQIYFTSGATESNNWVCSNFRRVMCSPYEHHSILHHPNTIELSQYCSFKWNIQDILPDLVSHMMVNNEVGTVFDIKEMSKICHENHVLFHSDCTQGFGHTPIDVRDLDIDFLSLSGHKFHAPKGVGILYIKEPDKFKPFLYGGAQEKNKRAGTENLAGIVAMGKACELHNYNEETDKYILSLKTHLATFIEENIPDVMNNSPFGKTVNNILNVSFKGIEGESLMLLLDRKGICVSSGSACNSGSLEPSHVLKNMGVPDDYIYGTVRFSFSEYNTMEEIELVEKELLDIVTKLRGK